jgi:hypothetical protein
VFPSEIELSPHEIRAAGVKNNLHTVNYLNGTYAIANAEPSLVKLNYAGVWISTCIRVFHINIEKL